MARSFTEDEQEELLALIRERTTPVVRQRREEGEKQERKIIQSPATESAQPEPPQRIKFREFL